MKPIELFGVLMKTLGACLVVFGLSQLPRAVMVATTYNANEQDFVKLFLAYYAAEFICVAIGYVLLFKTDWFVRLVYSEARPSDLDTGDAESVLPPNLPTESNE